MHTCKQLELISSLVSNCATIKSGMMQVLRGATKLDEKYSEFLIQLGALLNAPFKKDDKSGFHISVRLFY